MKKLLVIFTILISLVFAGCWDIVDISDKAYITALALDSVDPPDSEPKNIPLRYKVSAEILDPVSLRQTTTSLRQKTKASFIYTEKGVSIGSALELMQGQIAAPLTLTQLNVILIGEKMSEKNLTNIISFLEKSPEIARRLRIMFVKDGEALDILHSQPKLTRFISEELIAMAEVDGFFSMVRNESANDLIKLLRANNGQGVAARIFLSENNDIIRHGGAVIDDWRLVGWLSSEETREINWLVGKGKATLVGKYNEGIYTYRVRKKTVKITPIIENGSVRFEINLKADGVILQEENHHLDFTDPANTEKLEGVFSNIIQQEIVDAVAKAQEEFNVDYLQFGMRLMNKDHKFYEQLNWKEVFPDAPVDIKVSTKISNFGVTR